MTPQTEMTDVIYNPATQAFEARVTVREGNVASSYACSLSAPIALPFEKAAAGLARQALRRHAAPDGLRSWIESAAAQPIRMGPRKREPLRRGLPLGQYGFFRGRAA